MTNLRNTLSVNLNRFLLYMVVYYRKVLSCIGYCRFLYRIAMNLPVKGLDPEQDLFVIMSFENLI